MHEGWRALRELWPMTGRLSRDDEALCSLLLTLNK
jgi:hypothetical protein